MLKAHQDVNNVLNGFLAKYNITRAFNIVETPFVPGVKKINITHNEEGILKLQVNFFTSCNEVIKMVVLYCEVNSTNKSEELDTYYINLMEGK